MYIDVSRYPYISFLVTREHASWVQYAREISLDRYGLGGHHDAAASAG